MRPGAEHEATRYKPPAQMSEVRTATIGRFVWNSDAKTATPSGVPTCRLALSTPAPMPESAGGTLARMAAFIEGATRPAPVPVATRGTATSAKGAVAGNSASTHAAAASNESPQRIGARLPWRAPTRPALKLAH